MTCLCAPRVYTQNITICTTTMEETPSMPKIQKWRGFNKGAKLIGLCMCTEGHPRSQGATFSEGLVYMRRVASMLSTIYLLNKNKVASVM